MKTIFTLFYLVFLAAASLQAGGAGKHLFILSGQSNMERLDPEISFTPAIEAEFGDENVVIVHDAEGGQPIQRWYSVTDNKTGDLYARLMKKVSTATRSAPISTVTFLWMQGETNAAQKDGDLYKANLTHLLDQVAKDSGAQALNFVIGRLSDHALESGLKKHRKMNPHWAMIRDIQMDVADASPRGTWVNTDDLNTVDSKKGIIETGLHYSEDGYKIFGERLAAAAIALMQSQ